MKISQVPHKYIALGVTKTIEEIESISELLSAPIEILKLSQRCDDVLNKAGIQIVRELASLSEPQLRAIPAIGRLCMKEVVEVLAERGLRLSEQGDSSRPANWVMTNDFRQALEKILPLHEELAPTSPWDAKMAEKVKKLLTRSAQIEAAQQNRRGRNSESETIGTKAEDNPG